MKVKTIERDSDGQLPSFAWPGGYPIYYIVKDCSALCAKCATRSLDDPDEVPSFKPTDGDVYWEGPTMQCDQCNAGIESAYGDPEENKD